MLLNTKNPHTVFGQMNNNKNTQQKDAILVWLDYVIVLCEAHGQLDNDLLAVESNYSCLKEMKKNLDVNVMLKCAYAGICSNSRSDWFRNGLIAWTHEIDPWSDLPTSQ